MKFKRTILTTIILFILININSICFAKYVFDCTEDAAKLEIDRTPPVLNIEYFNKETTNGEVEVKITANEKIQNVDGWLFLEDGQTLVRSYDKNVSESIIVKDLSGNETIANIIITNIDKMPPLAEVIDISNTNLGYEKYANSTKKINIKIKISDTNKIVDQLENFIILVGTEENKCTKEYNIVEKNENYIIYEIKLTNITGDGKLFIKIPENSFEDIVGNKMEETILNSEIEIDNTIPKVQFLQESLENGKILAKIISNEPIRDMNGWKSDEEHKIHTKEFISDIEYMKYITDFADNADKITVQVKESTFLNFEVMAHISEFGWRKNVNNIVGLTGFGLKIESLAFRTSNNVDNDFVRGSAYVYTYWGEGSYAKSRDTGVIYNYGYNPLTGFKSMKDSELATINGNKYAQLGGEGINNVGFTDINGNNPIPIENANQYNYGISGIKFELKEYKENSIIYKIYLKDTGWTKTYKNGEEAMKSKDKPISAIKIAVVPNSELSNIIEQWDNDISQ